MININGKIISGKSVTVIKEQEISGGELGKTQENGEMQLGESINIDELLIDVDVIDVNISVSDVTDEIRMHLCGRVKNDKDISFDVQEMDGKLKIISKVNGTCYKRDLKLCIIVPRKKVFKKINIKTNLGNIFLDEEVKMNDLTVISNNGNLEIKAKFSVIYVRTVRGDVNIATNADDDIFVVLSSKTGNISVELSNIKHINLSLDTRTGRIRCRHRENVGYDADISASTVTGNIKIKWSLGIKLKMVLHPVLFSDNTGCFYK